MKDDNLYSSILGVGDDYQTYTAKELHVEDGEYLNQMNHYHSTCVLDDETRKRIESLTDEVLLFAVAERWCPDSIINLPALAIMESHSPQIQLRIITRTDLEHTVDEKASKDRILLPTVWIYKNKVFMGIFSVRPKVITQAENSDDQVRKIAAMKAYRDGQYMVETMCDILEFLNG